MATDPFGFVPQDDHVLRVRLAGLAPGTTYRVRAITLPAGPQGQEAEASEWKTFRTLNPAADSTTFVVWNDTHENDDT